MTSILPQDFLDEINLKEEEKEDFGTNSVIQAIEAEPWGFLTLESKNTESIQTEYRLSSDEVIIGRAPKCQIRISQINAKFVSREHAKITKTGAYTFTLTDNKSMNGTLVNGRKIDGSANLKHGDLIILAKFGSTPVGEYVMLDNGKKRAEFSSEQEWKSELVENFTGAYIYRFKMRDISLVTKNIEEVQRQASPKMSTAQEPPKQLSSHPPNQTPQRNTPQQSNSFTGKRKVDSENEGLEMAKCSKKLKEAFESEILCCICYNMFVEPRMLECGHNFCKYCLHGWLAKNHSCPLCRKKLSLPSYDNIALGKLVKEHVEGDLEKFEKDQYQERIKFVCEKQDEELAKLHGMIENAKIKKIKFLNIKDRWKLEEKRTFKNGVKQYFGKCREDFCHLVGITEPFVKNCTSEELIIACDNLEIPVAYMIVGQEIKTMRRVVDFDQTRLRLDKYYNARDNLFFI